MKHLNSIKKWLRRLIISLGILVVLFLTLSLIARQVAVHRAERDFPPPGRLIEVNGQLSHIHCTGEGTPTILIEAGLGDQGSWGWLHLLDELSQVSRVCVYDRAGYLWSEPREGPRDAERIADELHMLLEAASEPPPYVMAGHSLGGLFVLVYDRQYPGEIEGFVFVDASHPEQDLRFPEEIRKDIELRKSEPDRRWLMRLLAPFRTFIPENSTARTAYWWRSYPEGVLGEARAIDMISEQAARTDSLGVRPVIALSHGIPMKMMPNISEEASTAMRHTWLELHKELANLSTNSDHRVIEGAGHYIHRDRPEEVFAAIQDVVTAVRESEPVRRDSTASTQIEK